MAIVITGHCRVVLDTESELDTEWPEGMQAFCKDTGKSWIKIDTGFSLLSPAGEGGTSHAILSGTHTDSLQGTVVDGDIITGNATPKWSKLGITVPAANVRNVLGVDNGELRPSWKTALDGTTPEAIVFGGAGTPGTSLSFAHRDHVHAAPAAPSNPSWYGTLYGTQNGCDPVELIREWNMAAVAGPTPTGITASLARCVAFTPPANITVVRVRLFGVAATTNLYKFAIYPRGTGSSKTWDSGTVTSAANTWLNITCSFSLTAGTQYWFCVTAVTTGTVAGFRSLPAPLGTNFWGG